MNITTSVTTLMTTCQICGKPVPIKNVHTFKNKVYCNECFEQVKEMQKMTNEMIKPSRPGKIEYYLNIAKQVAMRSTCLRKKYGSIIVKDDVIVATGYNGAPRGRINCCDLNCCRREELGIKRGERYELCRSVHSEANAIINASREQMKDATIYLYGMDSNDEIIENLDSCQMCKKLILNSGITKVVFARPNDKYEVIDVQQWIDDDDSLSNKMGY